MKLWRKRFVKEMSFKSGVINIINNFIKTSNKPQTNLQALNVKSKNKTCYM